VKHENDTKTKLLLTAVNLIWESSYGSVSVDDICERAGVKKGSFYYAFKSKSDLAVAAFEHHWEAKRALLDKTFSSQVAPVQRIEAYCDLVIHDQLEKHRTFGKMLGCPFCSLGCELSTQDENIRLKVEDVNSRMKKYFEPTIRDLMNSGRIPQGDPHEVVQEMYSYMVGVLLQAKIENNPKLVENLKRGVLHLLNVRTEPVVA
jgi:TetR/AcrR family transcriptional regulator, transcriptional repressor for nem operon